MIDMTMQKGYNMKKFQIINCKLENTLRTDDGVLYENPILGSLEASIPNPFCSSHAADLLMLDNGDLLCVWFAGSKEGNADVSIVLSRLNKGERAWSVPKKVSEDGGRSEQNPSLFKKSEHELWLIYTAQLPKPKNGDGVFNMQYTAEIRYRKSMDNGYTWGDVEVLFSESGSFCRQKIQVLSNGRWIFGNWLCFQDDTKNGSDITVMQISEDEGKSWRKVEVPESRGRVHANIIEIKPGKLVAFFRSRAADYIYISHSGDWGDSWGKPERTELPNNNSGISAIRLNSGALGIVCNPVGFNEDENLSVWPQQRCPVVVAISDDEGVTWPYRRVIEMGEGFTGEANSQYNKRYEYPVMMQTKDGKIHVAYSWANRYCIKYVCIDEDWIRGIKTPIPEKTWM